MSRSSTLADTKSPLSTLSELEEIGQRLETIADQVIHAEVAVPGEALPFKQLFTPLVRLYAATSEAAGQEFTPVTSDATATDVVMLDACVCVASRARPQSFRPRALVLPRRSQPFTSLIYRANPSLQGEIYG